MVEMRRTQVRQALIVVMLCAGAAQSLAAQASDSVVYRIDPSSRLVVKTGKSGFFGFAGHNHVIRARDVSGEMVYRAGEPKSRLHLVVPTDRLEVLTPPDTAEIRKVTKSMRTEVLHVEKHPRMTFAADDIEAKTGKVELQLAVTMEGTTRRIPVTADVKVSPDRLTASGTFTAKQTDFGIKPFKGGPGGIVKVADQVTFCFDLVAVRAEATGKEVPAEEAAKVPGCVDNTRPQTERDRRPM